mmetsp:Transcript_58843/g.133203  ORF Transcript_58843/g.133203 Transcript_58843/m.133203 type:complete len:277 (-) Transcript_58843:200-1030(-)
MASKPEKSTAQQLQPFVTSGMAACTASSIIHPIDLAKVRLQLFAVTNPGVKPPGFVGLLQGMVARDGIKSIYAGLSASLTRQCTYGTARMGIHRSISDYLSAKNGGGPISFVEKAGAGLVGGALAVCIGTPFDVALVRMQADTMKSEAERRNYRGVGDALKRIAGEEGFGALYKGLAPNIGRGMAMNVGMMACSDQAKELMIAITKDDPKKPSLTTRMGAAATGGFFAAFLSLPFDLLKSRLQDVRPGPDGKLPYTGLSDCALQVSTHPLPLLARA